MFSQLCRARPRNLWNKLGVRHTTVVTNESHTIDDTEIDGEDRCQLEHCTFCDFRLCCQVTNYPEYQWEIECLQSTDPSAQVTENPAYGLSSKIWLEAVEVANDDLATAEVISMESSDNLKQNVDSDTSEESLILTNALTDITTSQQGCNDTSLPKMNPTNYTHYHQNKMESKPNQMDETRDTQKNEQSANDLNNGKLTWSVLKHRQFSNDILKNCDNKTSSVIEHSTNDKSHQINCQDRNADLIFMKTKKSLKDKSFPLSLMKPIVKINDKRVENPSQQHFNHTPKIDISRQRPVQRNIRDRYHHSREMDSLKKSTNDVLGLNNPLSEITQIKTEESIQEWLARISESANSTWPEDINDKDIRELSQKSPSNSINNTDEEKNRDNINNIRHKPFNCHSNTDDILSSKNNHIVPEMSNTQEKLCYDDLSPKTEELDMESVLSNASKKTPANVPMVVMQCSRLHSHIGCKPPFQQTSLPMGTLVTALYQDSEWLYIQTPHGIEGFVSASNCAAIGTVNEPSPKSRRPWEPCDFPIQTNSSKKQEFGQQQGSYIPAKLPPTTNGKQLAPFVNTVKMKTNFYNDRYFPNHTFKTKDSIKIAKTVTDILRSSPETKVSNQ